MRLVKDGVTVGNRTYTQDSVVEVDEVKGRALVEGKDALPSDGPAFEAEPKPEPEAKADGDGKKKK